MHPFGSILLLDILTFVVAVITLFYSWSKIRLLGKSEIREFTGWVSAGIFFILLHKIISWFGGRFIGYGTALVVLEDLSFLIGFLCLLRYSYLSFKFLVPISFKPKR